MPEPHLMRASDADRAGVAEVMQQAFVDGRLTRPELDERLAQVWQARTLGDLEPLTSDLVAGTAHPSGRAMLATQSGGSELQTGRPAPGNTRWVVLGEHKVVGVEWHVPERMSANVVLGEMHLDLANARFDTSEVTIQCNVHLGSLMIYVPEYVRIIDATSHFLASIESKGMLQRNPRYTVRLAGLVSLSSVELYGPEHRKYRKATGLHR